jgi:hypothetical protein
MLKLAVVTSSVVFCVGSLLAAAPAGDLSAFVRHAVLQANGLRQSVLNAVGEPEPPPPSPQPPVEPAACRLWEIEEQIYRLEHERAQFWIPDEDIQCPDDAELPAPWCDPKVQAAFERAQDERGLHGVAPMGWCGVGEPQPQAPLPPPFCE